MSRLSNLPSVKLEAKPPRHHGDLLNALIRAADVLVSEDGVRAVSLRTVAERVSADGKTVSHTAAFAHVGGQLELLSYVAGLWWRKLHSELAGVDPAIPADKRLAQLGVVYRRFAVEHPHQFRVMYDVELWEAIERRGIEADTAPSVSKRKVHRFRRPEILHEVSAGRDASFELFLAATTAGVSDGSLRQDRPPELMARAIASVAHGLAMEALDEKLEESEVVPILELVVDGLRSRTGA